MRNKNETKSWYLKVAVLLTSFAFVFTGFAGTVSAVDVEETPIAIPSITPTPTPTPTVIVDPTPTPTPTPEDTLTFNFIKYVCDDFTVIEGNDEADFADDGGGKYTQFSNYDFDSDGIAPFFPDYVGEVNPSEKPEGCEGSSDWDFLLSTDQGQSSNTQIVGLTNSSGVLQVPFSGLRSEIQDALSNGGEMWISEVEQSGYEFGAIRCYVDALNGDNLELISFGQNGLPEGDIYCIAYNVATDDGGDDEEGSDISGIVYNDENQNNNQDEGENGLNGWTVNLYDVSDGEVLVQSTESDSNGNYNFLNLDPGCYAVKEVVQPDWVQTEPDVVGHFYLVALGGADCWFELVPVPTGLEFLTSLFVKTAQAEEGGLVVSVPGDAIGLDFGNYTRGGGSSGGGGSSSGSRNPDPTPTPGQVLGAEDPAPTPTVLDAITQLPRTGLPLIAGVFVLIAVAVDSLRRRLGILAKK